MPRNVPASWKRQELRELQRQGLLRTLPAARTAPRRRTLYLALAFLAGAVLLAALWLWGALP